MNKAQGNNIGFIFFEAEKQKNIKNRDSYKMKYRFFVRLIQNNYFATLFQKSDYFKFKCNSNKDRR